MDLYMARGRFPQNAKSTLGTETQNLLQLSRLLRGIKIFAAMLDKGYALMTQ